MTKLHFTQCNLTFVKVYPVAYELWSAPCIQHPATSFNILHLFTLANTTQHHCPAPAQALLHEQQVPQLVLPLLQLHCSLQHCPGNQLRSSNNPQKKHKTLKTRVQTDMLWKNVEECGRRTHGAQGDPNQRCLPHLVATAKCVKMCKDV